MDKIDRKHQERKKKNRFHVVEVGSEKAYSVERFYEELKMNKDSSRLIYYLLLPSCYPIVLFVMAV